MPLIIISGYPSSGKTKRTRELKEYFEKQGKEVLVVDEQNEVIKAGFEKNNFYSDSRKEKHIRGLVKSEVLKLITPRNLVILDGPNYIKGYRYELYCATKANHCTQCTIYTIINVNTAWEYNLNRDDDRYERGVFDGLVMRYEEPDGRNRWDAPLFITVDSDELNLQGVEDCLFNKKAPPPNMSTQNPPLSSTNFLYDMNNVVREITTAVTGLIKAGYSGEVPVPGYPKLELDLTDATIPKVITLSRQYLTYSKMHTPDLKDVPQLYIQYLKTNLAGVS